MWRIIKAEIEREKYAWLFTCAPLIIFMPISYIYGHTWFENGASSSTIINLARGFTIILALVILRSILEFLRTGNISHFHMRIPITVAQLGIVRANHAFALSICVLSSFCSTFRCCQTIRPKYFTQSSFLFSEHSYLSSVSSS